MITVMLPCRNNINYLRESIDSILTQSYQDFELIIVDDFSDEPVWDILDTIKDERVRKYKNDKQIGLPQTLNKIIDLSKGDIFCRQDNDDISHKDKLKLQLELLQQGNDFIACKYQKINENGNLINSTWIDNANKATPEFIKKNITKESYIVGPAVMWSRKVFNTIGYFDPLMKIASDYNFFVRILKYFNVRIVNKVLYYHRKHKDSHRKFDLKYRQEDNIKTDYYHLALQRAETNTIIKDKETK